MRLGDPEYQRQKALIESIPSNKIDVIDLSGLTDAEMAEFGDQHERDLRAQIRAFDDADKEIVVDEILNENWTIVWNVFGKYFMKLYTQIMQIRKTTE